MVVDEETKHGPSAAPPAGPRATRSTSSMPTAPSGPASSIRGAAASVTPSAESKTVPTGPSKPSPATTPVAPYRNAMGPPNTSLTVDEERAAARARKFGAISKPLPPSAPASATTSTSTSAVKPEAPSQAVEARPKSPPSTSRRTTRSPSRTHRSGSVDSKVSERSKLDRREREDRERDQARTLRNGPTAVLSRPEDSGRRSRAPSEKVEEGGDRKAQENVLQARAERMPVSDQKSTDRRRSSRDTASAGQRPSDRPKDEPDQRKPAENGSISRRDEVRLSQLIQN